MGTTPITLTPVGGPPYSCIKGHLVHLYRGAWILDVEISADDLQTFGMPSGKVVVVFGGLPMSGTIDPTSSGTFGPTARARVVAGGNGWSSLPMAQDFHMDGGLLSTTVYQAVGAAVGEVVVDLAPTTLGTDFIVSSNDPAMQVFGDDSWFVDTTGTTYHGPRPPAVADPSLVIRDWDPIHEMASFSCDTLLLPGTLLLDPRFNGETFTAYNVEQVFDGEGSTGWAWSSTSPAALVVDDLKAATLYWTRAGFLRAYRYRLIQYQGDGPWGGPTRMALQAVTPSAGVPNILPIAPWSGVPGVLSTLAPSQEVLVVFENADPTLPRVVSYNLTVTDGQPVGLPLQVSHDAVTELDFGLTALTVNIGKQAVAVNLAEGTDYLVLATPYAGLLGALSTFAGSVTAAVTPPPTTLPQAIAALTAIGAAATTLTSALGSLPPAATEITKAS
jgi:hypothetical protein